MKSMNFFGTLSTLITIAVLLIALKMCSTEDTGYVQSKEVSNDKMLEAIRKEPKVREATVNSADVLYISVDDDGTRRDGLAGYFCKYVQEYGTDISMIRIVEHGTTKSPKRDNAYGIILGESMCEWVKR